MALTQEEVVLFRNEKMAIIKYWLGRRDILDILTHHNIDREYFVKKYAFNVFDYYFDILDGQQEPGNCPVISELMSFLKNKHLTSDELFTLCATFKSSLLYFCNKLGLYTYERSAFIIEVYEKNFMGVLKEYSKKILKIHSDLERSLLMVDKYIIMSRTDTNGIITKVSEAFCEISGYSAQELLGKSHNILRDPEIKDDFYEQMWEVLSQGKTWQGEIRNLNKNAQKYWVYATIQPHFNDKGQVIYYDAIRQDITSKKEVEEQHHMLVEQSKYAAMGEMISMIAHQWRQPLQAVSILVQKLPLIRMLDREITEEILNQTVSDVSLQLDYMSNTIDDFREFFKPSKDKVYIKISYVIDQAVSFLSYMFKVETIDLTVTVEKDLELLLYDREIIQVLINIMKNAKDILVEENIQKKKISLRVYEKHHYAVIEIQDNAGGVPSKILNRIFEPYFSTKENKNGTGLGLYMSKMIIEQHSHGKLSVTNTEDGALFKIELPMKI